MIHRNFRAKRDKKGIIFFVSENEFYIDLYIEYAFTAGMKYKMYNQVESFITVSVISSVIYSLSRNFIMFRNVNCFHYRSLSLA